MILANTIPFICLFLHQTTTEIWEDSKSLRCNSFRFYIKPQLLNWIVVASTCCNSFRFYIKPQLCLSVVFARLRCNSFRFYIKPQLPVAALVSAYSCNSFRFYIKPQLQLSIQIVMKVVIHFVSTSNHN